MALASKMLESEKKGETSDDSATGLERKDPTNVSAVDHEDAVNKEKSTTFGKGVLIKTRPDRELKDFSIAGAVRGLVTGRWNGCELEKEWIQKTTLEVDDDSLGGFLVPDVTRSEIMEKLRAKEVFKAAGATILPDSPLVQNLPTQTGNTTAYMVGQGAQTSAITQSEPTFGNKRLVLRRMAARSLVDMSLLKRSPFAVEALVRKDIVKTMALKADQQHWKGQGGTEVDGILYDPSLTNTHSSIGAVDLTTHVKGALDTMEARDAGDNITGMIMHPTVYGYLTNKVDGIDRALLLGSYNQGYKGKQIFGYPVFTSTQIDSGYILIGDFSEYFIAEGGGIEIMVLRERYADQLAVGLVAVQEFDGLARQTAEFELLAGITS